MTMQCGQSCCLARGSEPCKTVITFAGHVVGKLREKKSSGSLPSEIRVQCTSTRHNLWPHFKHVSMIFPLPIKPVSKLHPRFTNSALTLCFGTAKLSNGSSFRWCAGQG